MSRRAIKAINWAGIAERIPETQKNNFAIFKAKSDQYLRSMTQYPEAPPKIDWEHYKKGIKSPGLVEKFKKEYETLSIPYPVDKYTDGLLEQEKAVEAKMAAFIEDTNKAVEECKQNIERVRNLLPFSEMTMEDAAELYPKQIPTGKQPLVWPPTKEYQPEYLETLPKENESH